MTIAAVSARRLGLPSFRDAGLPAGRPRESRRKSCRSGATGVAPRQVRRALAQRPRCAATSAAGAAAHALVPRGKLTRALVAALRSG
jgi:hypothetical protein